MQRNESFLSECRPPKFIQSDAGDGTRAEDHYLYGISLYGTVFSLLILIFVVALDYTIISTLLTTISVEFAAFDKIGWLISGFMLPVACLAPSYGRISIAFGRKPTILVGITFFAIGSLICALSKSMNMLIGGRVVSGLGAGAIYAMVYITLSECIPIHRRSISLATFGIVNLVASVVGPIIGGAFVQNNSWRWCFYLNLPFGVTAFLILLVFFHPPSVKMAFKERLALLDIVGTLLLTTGLTLVLMAFALGGSQFPWSSPQIISFFVAGGFFLLIFIIWNFKLSKVPLFVKEVVFVPQVLAATLCSFFINAVFYAVMNFMAIFLQVVHEKSAYETGVDLLPLMISVSVAAILNGIVMQYTYYVKVPLMIAGILAPVGAGVLLLLDLETPSLGQMCLLVPIGIAMGLLHQATLISAQLVAPGHIPGSTITVTNFMLFMRTLGAIVGVFTSQNMLFGQITLYLTSYVRKHQKFAPFLDTDPRVLLRSPQALWNLPPNEKKVAIQAFMKGTHGVFCLNLGYALVAFVCALFTTNKWIPHKDEIKYNENAETAGSDSKTESDTKTVSDVSEEPKKREDV